MSDISERGAQGTDEQQILECIARAEERAGGDDRLFVQYLNECYASKAPALRLRSLPTAPGPPQDRTPKAQQLFSDPRYLKNARALAQRMQGGTRVIGGMPVARNEYLDCVAVGADFAWGCTGTLIAPDVVITACHCRDVATRVFFGNDVTRGGRTISVGERFPHPEYRSGDKRNDLMVLRLAERVTNIAPRRIADKATIDHATDGRVVGFGNTDPRGSEGYGIKRQVDVPIASASCEGFVDGATDTSSYRCHAGFEFVAGKPLLAKDSCTGDSGGPFYVEGTGGWLLGGATSRATNAAPNDCGDGGIYVQIDRYVEWIRQLPGIVLG